jgi:3-phosphoshikimate 1-carboxyvinyltransferase
MGMIYEPLIQLGAACEINGHVAPITVCGPLTGGKAVVSGAISSQFLSGLLLALPKAYLDSEIFVKELHSRAYVRMTLDTMAQFGIEVDVDKDFNKFVIRGNQNYSAVDTVIEGDWSGASFMLVAGAIAGEVTVTGLERDSVQADRVILNALELSGARFQWNHYGLTVSQSNLRSFDFDATDCPDLFPPLVVLACCSEGTSRIRGASRLTYKESNRGVVLASVFSALGGNIKISGDTMEVVGGYMLGGGIVDPNNDHRIAMACAIAGLVTRYGVGIVGGACVLKSYPDFFQVLQSIRGRS